LKIIILTGPTATGKSTLSIELAENFPFEIINCDSMQVYKYFNIGTDKPHDNVIRKYPHHLLGYVEPTTDYNVKIFTKHANKKIKEIIARGKIPLLVGGTGLYIKCLLFGIIEENDNKEKILREKLKSFETNYLYNKLKILDFESFKKINGNDRYRIVRALSYFYANGKPISAMIKQHGFQKSEFNYMKFSINFNRELLYKKINLRVDKMIEKGLIEETEHLIAEGFSDTRPMKGIGYREIKLYLNGELSKKRAIELIKQNSRKYAKRQITWFKKETDLNIIDLKNKEAFFEKVKNFLQE